MLWDDSLRNPLGVKSIPTTYFQRGMPKIFFFK